MGKTIQGIETKRVLLEESSKLFHKHGYKNTKMQVISESVGITIGSIQYYFKRKEDIAGELLRRYLLRLYRYIQENSPNSLDTFTLHTTANLPYYKNMYGSANIKRFYYELLTTGSMHSDINASNTFRSLMDEINFKIAKENGLDLNDFQKELLTIFNSGGRNAVVTKIMEDYFSESEINKAINYISISTGFVFGLSKNKIYSALDYCHEFNATHEEDLKTIRLF